MDLRPVRLFMAGGVLFSVLRAVLQWIAPWPLKIVFDNVLATHHLPTYLRWLPHGRMGRLDVASVAIIAIAALLAVFAYGANALLANAGQRLVFNLRVRLFRHIESQSMAFHYRNTVGDLLSRLSGDVQAMQGVVVDVFPIIVENVLTIVGIVVIMLMLNWAYGLMTLSLVPILYWTVRHYLAAIKSTQREARDNEGRASANAHQVLIALPVVQVFGGEDREAQRYSELAMDGLDASKRAVLLQSRFTPIVTATMTSSSAIVVYFGARAVMSGALTPGDLIVFMAYLRGIYTPVRQLAKVAAMLGRGQASAERVVEVLRTHEELPAPPSPRPIGRAKGTITFDRVSFAYPGGEPVVKAVTLEVAAGSRHALIGATGSGKSTLLRLVPRFADPNQGAVLLDGVDLRDLDLAALRRQIAFVPQEPSLLGATVWENIAYGLDEPSRQAAIVAARQAGVHEVIAALRDGYDTLVGERGGGLSGGQRQCVAVARAMARNAPVILLDEPTTGLDASTEAVLLAALDRLAQDRTTIFVTHQLGAVRNADRITVLSHGEVAEEGRHSDLLEARTAYWRLQQSATSTGQIRDVS